MGRPSLVEIMKQNALAVLSVDPSGKLMTKPILHQAGEAAPLRLIVILEEGFDGEETILAEIGVGKTHPYKNLNFHPQYNVLKGSNRQCPRTASVEQVRALVPDLVQVLNSLVEQRSARWSLTRTVRLKGGRVAIGDEFDEEKLMEIERKKLLYGIWFSVHHRDEALVRFFEEWELLNELDLEPRIARVRHTLDFTGRPHTGRYLRDIKTRTRRKLHWNRNSPRTRDKDGYPEGYYGFRRDLASRMQRMSVFTRPHMLGVLAQKLDHPLSFFQFLQDKKLLSDGELGKAVKAWQEGPRKYYGFRILGPEIARFTGEEIHNRKDTIAVDAVRIWHDYTVFQVSLKSSDWARKAKEEWEKRMWHQSALHHVAEKARAEFGADGNGQLEIPKLLPEELAELGEQGN